MNDEVMVDYIFEVMKLVYQRLVSCFRLDLCGTFVASV